MMVIINEHAVGFHFPVANSRTSPHCEVKIDHRGPRIRDLGSTNHTVVDGVRVESGFLKHGSNFRLGRVELRFELLDQINQLPLSQNTKFGRMVSSSVAMRACFRVMERAATCDATVLFEGETLANLIERKKQLDLAEMCDLLGQTCDGVQAAHNAGIIHRDIKPANLFITSRDGKPFVKLVDFGVSKFQVNAVEDMITTREGTLLGTPFYMAPEQIQAKTDLDARIDVYALGVILYECATGEVPYRAENLPALGLLIGEGVLRGVWLSAG